MLIECAMLRLSSATIYKDSPDDANHDEGQQDRDECSAPLRRYRDSREIRS
jgi:hypothetical protein